MTPRRAQHRPYPNSNPRRRPTAAGPSHRAAKIVAQVALALVLLVLLALAGGQDVKTSTPQAPATTPTKEASP